MSDALVKVLGWRATLIHGDTMVRDRWSWFSRRIPLVEPAGARLIDVGCGSGAFTMGAALRGYEAVGLSWDERNQAIANGRAAIIGLKTISFPICDVRRLDERPEFQNSFDIAICSENIEHIINDDKLIRDIFGCLKPGGRLLVSTPNFYYHPLEFADRGPFADVEDGRHVRRGYSPAMLRELCDRAGFVVEEIDHVSFFFSQIGTKLTRLLNKWFGLKLGWTLLLPYRIVPVLFDQWLGKWLSEVLAMPGFSITMVAYKPRFTNLPKSEMGVQNQIE